MAESEDGNLGVLSWEARLQLSQLESDIAEVDRRLAALFDRYDGRELSASFNLNESLQNVRRTGNDSGSSQSYQEDTPLGGLRQEIAAPVAMEVNSDSIQQAERRMQDLAAAMQNVRRETGEVAAGSSRAAVSTDDRDALASSLENRMRVAAASGDWEGVRVAQQELAANFTVMGEGPRVTPLADGAAATKEPNYSEAWSSARAAERDEQMRRAADLEYRLSDVTDKREQAATIRTAALDEEDGGIRQTRLLTRANMLERRADEEDEGGGDEDGGGGRGSSLFNLRGLSRHLGGGILLYEGLRVGQDVVNYNDRVGLDQGNGLAQAQDQAQLAQSIGNFPILGQVASIVAGGLQRIGGGGDTYAAVEEAQRGLQYADSGEHRIETDEANRLSAQRIRSEGIVERTYGPLSRRREEIMGQASSDVIAERNHIEDLRRQTQAEQDPVRRQYLRDQYDQAIQNQPEVERTIVFRTISGLADIRRDVGFANDDLAHASAVWGLQANGQTGAANEAIFYGGLQRNIDRADPLLQPGLQQAMPRQIAAHLGMIDEDVDVHGMQDVASGLRLEHHPLEADLQDIAARERAETDAAPIALDAIRSAIKQQPGQSDADYQSEIQSVQAENEAVQKEIQQRYGLLRAGVQQQYRERGDRLNDDLGTRADQLNALRGIGFGGIPNAIAAQAEGEAQSGIDQAVDLDRQGFGDQAVKLLGNTRSQLSFDRESYLREFRGVQVDPRFMNINNPRDVADVAGTLRAIDQQQAKLPKSLQELNAKAGVTDVVGGGGKGLANITQDQLSTIISKAVQSGLQGAIAN